MTDNAKYYYKIVLATSRAIEVQLQKSHDRLRKQTETCGESVIGRLDMAFFTNVKCGGISLSLVHSFHANSA